MPNRTLKEDMKTLGRFGKKWATAPDTMAKTLAEKPSTKKIPSNAKVKADMAKLEEEVRMNQLRKRKMKRG